MAEKTYPPVSPVPAADPPAPSHTAEPPNPALALVLAAAAGGMGWGIRGQYGHETGAMVPGLLVALTLVLLLAPRIGSLAAARAVALTAVAFGFGGSMTYGQTVGLTHDAPLHGDRAALAWGMLGLFLKGGVWIGFAGAFLGMGLGGHRYRPLEAVALFAGMVGLLLLGTLLLNRPFEPEEKRLPLIYFSDHWRWEPGAELRPRPERWGGLLLALAGLVAYLAFRKRDVLGRNLAGAGFLAGGIGFPLGQSLQAWRARQGAADLPSALAWVDPYLNWWNLMEITFGAVLGAGLALGLWLNRRHIAAGPNPAPVPDPGGDGGFSLSPAAEAGLIAVHVAAVATWNFSSVDALDAVADLALTMGVIPVAAALGGRYSAYLVALPVVALPIAGKTVRELAYRSDQLAPGVAWITCFVLPLALAAAAALYFGRRPHAPASTFAAPALILTTWLYFALNFAFFRFPWPWAAPTGRTPSAAIFLFCAVLLTIFATAHRRPGGGSSGASPQPDEPT